MNKFILQDIQEIAADPNINWAQFKDATILITGASGFIGSMLARTFLYCDKKFNLNIDLQLTGRNIEKLTQITKDFQQQPQLIISDIENLNLNSDNLDYIFHCANITDSKMMLEQPVEVFRTAINGTSNILNLARQYNATLIFLSSMEAYGIINNSEKPITEEKLGTLDLESPRTSYPESKRACECLCNLYSHEYDIKTRIIRLAQTFGPGLNLNDNRAPMYFTKCALRKENIVLRTTGETILNFCYISDAISGILTSLNSQKKHETFNICNDNEHPNILQAATMIVDNISHNQIRIDIQVPKESSCYAPTNHMLLSSAKIKNYGWAPKHNLFSSYQRLYDYISTL